VTAAPEEFEAEGGLPDVLRDPVGIVRRRWRWMLVALALGVAAVVAFVASMKPRYEAATRVMVTTQQIREDIVRTTLEDDEIERLNALLGEVLSRARLADLIEKHDPYPELRDDLTLAEIADLVRADVGFEPVAGLKTSGGKQQAALYELRFEARTPEIAAGFANDLATNLVNESIGTRTEDAQLAVSFLRGELDRAENALREQSHAIRQFKEEHRGELPGELQANLAKLERLQQQRQSLALQIAEANTRLAMLSTPQTGPTASLSESPTVRLEQLRAELRERRGSVTEKHPDVQRLQRQIEQLEEELGVGGEAEAGAAPTRPSLISAEQHTLEELRRQLVQTEAELGDLDRRVGQTPARQEELDGMVQRETVLRDTYVGFLKKVQEAELAKSLESAQQGERFSVIEQAVPPTEPARSRVRYLAAGLVAALGLAGFVGIALELLDPVLVTLRQLERESGLPVLGSVPRIS
jgi:uncharacterized protein involved in exopolysaccharide biosynthesis